MSFQESPEFIRGECQFRACLREKITTDMAIIKTSVMVKIKTVQSCKDAEGSSSV